MISRIVIAPVASGFITRVQVAGHGTLLVVKGMFGSCADTAFVMAHGQVTYAGPSAGAMDAVQSAYLGAGA